MFLRIPPSAKVVFAAFFTGAFCMAAPHAVASDSISNPGSGSGGGGGGTSGVTLTLQNSDELGAQVRASWEAPPAHTHIDPVTLQRVTEPPPGGYAVQFRCTEPGCDWNPGSVNSYPPGITRAGGDIARGGGGYIRFSRNPVTELVDVKVEQPDPRAPGGVRTITAQQPVNRFTESELVPQSEFEYSTTTYIALRGFAPGTTYEARVAALSNSLIASGGLTTEFGGGGVTWSDTAQLIIPPQPLHVQTSPAENARVTLTWRAAQTAVTGTPPNLRAYAPASYRVRWRLHGTSDYLNANAAAGETATAPYTTPALTRGADYEFHAQAHTALGPGAWVSAIPVRAGAVGGLQLQASADSIRAHWVQSPGATSQRIRRRVTGTTLWHDRAGVDAECNDASAANDEECGDAASGSSHTLSNLRAGVRYDIAVGAVYADGVVWSAPLQEVTLSGENFLASLRLSGDDTATFTLSPRFAPHVQTYALVESYAQHLENGLRAHAVAQSPHASIGGGLDESPTALGIGRHALAVTVTAQNENTRTYMLTLHSVPVVTQSASHAAAAIFSTAQTAAALTAENTRMILPPLAQKFTAAEYLVDDVGNDTAQVAFAADIACANCIQKIGLANLQSGAFAGTPADFVRSDFAALDRGEKVTENLHLNFIRGLQTGQNIIRVTFAADAQTDPVAYLFRITRRGMPPSMPQSFRVTPGPAQLQLAWQMPAQSASAVTAYQLRWKIASAATFAANDSAQLPAAARAHTINHLQAATTYAVAVRAQSAFGDGAWSEARGVTGGFVLDVDGVAGSGAQDGIIAARYLLGARGRSLTAGLTFPAPPGTNYAAASTAMAELGEDIAAQLRVNHAALDVDNNGVTAADGIMLARYLLGVRGASVTAGQSDAAAEEVARNIKKLLAGGG